MQRSQTLQLARSLRAPTQITRLSRRRYTAVPAPEPGYPTGQEFLANKHAVKEHAHHTTALWRNISFFVVIPAIIGGSYWVWKVEQEHAEHKEHHPTEFIDYPYLNRRAHPFPWGNNTLFFNPHTQKNMEEGGEAEH